ncbi:hypothetical protein RND81_13G110400 [Saponaria officinalis]|uniref:Uncharacterized protein n=1 Tax=Saponaria officinalis TaxID=3572 RepID=A0AAW1H2Q2_SAPOF
MPASVSRDRLSRPVDISTLLDGATHKVNLTVDDPGLKRVGLSGTGSRNLTENGSGGGSMDGGVVVQRPGGGRGHDCQTKAVGARCGGGRGRKGQLPSWYSRTPLRDITNIMRAIERRAELGLNQDTEIPQENHNAENAHVDQELVVSTPIAVKPRPSPATQKAINDEWTVDSSDSVITPQRMLLDTIEQVSQEWVDQQLKLEKAPRAKRVERENKVRVLMSMR